MVAHIVLSMRVKLEWRQSLVHDEWHAHSGRMQFFFANI